MCKKNPYRSQILLSIFLFSFHGKSVSQADEMTGISIIERSVKAIHALGAVTYYAESSIAFPGTKPRSIFTKGNVSLQRDTFLPDPLLGKIIVSSNGSYGFEEGSFDGSIARRIQHSVKTFSEGKSSNGAVALVYTSAFLTLINWPLLAKQPFSEELNSKSIKYLGIAAVDSMLCYVVEVMYDNPMRDDVSKRIWFSAADYLPRKIHSLRKVQAGTFLTEIQFQYLKIMQSIPVESFKLNVPGNYSYKPFVKGKPVLPIAVSEMAPSFQLKDGEGKIHSLTDYKGNIVLLNFWDSWCGYSNLGLADMKTLHKKYGDKIKFLGINFQDDNIDPVKYLKDRGISYTTLLHGDAVAKQYNVEGAPAFYIIDKQSKIAFGVLEYSPGIREKIEATIEEMIKEDR